MAEKKQNTVVEVIEDGKTSEKDMVTITVQKRYPNDKRRFISINGKMCSVKTGVPVKMPRAMARIIRQSEAQKASYDALIDKLKGRVAAPTGSV